MTKEELLAACHEIDFPQTCLSAKSIQGNYNYLVKTPNISVYSNTCTKLIQHFHHSLWLANREGCKSPYDAWHDDKLLLRTITNRLKYKGDNISINDIKAGLTVGRIAPKVSVFRPATAKYIIQKYLNDFTTIFDPCSGYSGRLLGAACLNKTYIGQDINSVTINESKELIKTLNIKNCQVSCKNSLNTIGEYESLFTCPPYGSLENWNQDIEELEADEWIDICLENYKCKRYVFVVNKTEKYTEYIKEELTNQSYNTKSKEYIIVIDK